ELIKIFAPSAFVGPTRVFRTTEHTVEAAARPGAADRKRPPIGRVIERRDEFQVGNDLAPHEPTHAVEPIEASEVVGESVSSARAQILAGKPERVEHVGGLV